MTWEAFVNSGWRRIVGMTLIAFALINVGLYYADTRKPPPATTTQSTVSSDAVLAAASVAPSTQPTSQAPKGKINVNTATSADLDSLPGIGAAKAKAIIDYRAAHPLKTLSDLQKVKGIGPKIAQKLAPLIEF